MILYIQSAGVEYIYCIDSTGYAEESLIDCEMGKMLDFIDEKILKVQPKNESMSFKFYMFSIIT